MFGHFIKYLFYSLIPLLVIVLIFTAVTGKVFNFGKYWDLFFSQSQNINYLTQNILNDLQSSWYYITHFDINNFSDMLGFFNNIGDLIKYAFKIVIDIAGLLVAPIVDLMQIAIVGFFNTDISQCWVTPQNFGDVLLPV